MLKVDMRKVQLILTANKRNAMPVYFCLASRKICGGVCSTGCNVGSNGLTFWVIDALLAGGPCPCYSMTWCSDALPEYYSVLVNYTATQHQT